jgi:hypothetical protein
MKDYGKGMRGAAITAQAGRPQGSRRSVLVARVVAASILGLACNVDVGDEGDPAFFDEDADGLDPASFFGALAPAPREPVWDVEPFAELAPSGGTLGSLGGAATATGSGPGAFQDGAIHPMPFRTPSFDVTRAQVATSMKAGGTVTSTDRVGISSGTWSSHGATYCHTQGIAVAHDRFITSCMTNNVVKANREGFLQIYRRHPDQAGAFVNGNNSGETANVRVYAQPRPHAAVGPGATGVRVTAPNGSQSSRFLGKVLVPVVSEGSGQNVAARVDLRGGEGTVRYSFLHSPAPGDDQKGLACASLLTMNDKGKPTLYVMALSKSYLYLYRVFWSGGEETWFSHHQQVVAARAQDLVVGDQVWPKPGGGNLAYQSIALIKGSGGKAYLLAGHDEWLDTYQLVTPTAAELAGDASLSPLMVDKIANRKWSGNGKKGLFYEGMAVEKTGPRSFHLWLAPKDYRNVFCRVGTPTRVKCTTLWKVAKTF